MRISVGMNAPLFIGESVNIGTISLENNRGKKVLLVFGRYFGCPVCQYEFDMLQKMFKELPTNVQVIYIVQSAPEIAKKFAEEKEANFPIISVLKTGGKWPIYADYGVGKIKLTLLPQLKKRADAAYATGIKHGPKEGSEMQSPAYFIIDESGKIQWVHIGLFEPEKVLAILKK
jgi:peroxiredoxin Q/BCP